MLTHTWKRDNRRQCCQTQKPGNANPPPGKLTIGVFLAAICLMMSIPPTPWAHESPNEVPQNGFTPPLNSNGHVDVRIGLYITNLIAVDEVREQFSISGYLRASWKDPRVGFETENGAEARRAYQLGRLWIPQLVMANRIAARDKLSTSIDVEADGTVEYLEEFAADLSSDFELRSFPFDHQTLEIAIQPFLDERQALNLLPDPSSTAVTSEKWAGLSHWDFQGVSAFSERAEIANSAERIPEIEFRLELKRRSAFYVWRIGVPLIVIVLVSYCTLWITQPGHDTQLTVATNAILIMIAFLFVISASLPRIPYLTYIDEFYLTCFIFTFLTLVDLVTVHRLLLAERVVAAKRLLRVSRLVYPVLFVLSNLTVAAGFFGI